MITGNNNYVGQWNTNNLSGSGQWEGEIKNLKFYDYAILPANVLRNIYNKDNNTCYQMIP